MSGAVPCVLFGVMPDDGRAAPRGLTKAPPPLSVIKIGEQSDARCSNDDTGSAVRPYRQWHRRSGPLLESITLDAGLLQAFVHKPLGTPG